GPRSLTRLYAHGSFLNPIAEWYGRLHPSASGYSTRAAWVRRSPHSSQAQLLWAEALLRNLRYIEAEKAARLALQIDPSSLSARLALGDALYGQGREVKAGLQYEAAARACPGSLSALLGLGRVALSKKLLAMGLDVYRKAVTLDPRCADAWVGLGQAQFNAALDIGGAVSAFRRAAALAPNRTDFFPTYANALRAEGRYSESEALLRRRLVDAPEEASTYFYLALNLLQSNVTQARRAEAERCLRTSLDLNPQGVSARVWLGRLLLDTGRPAEAAVMLESALKLDPVNGSAGMMLARAYRSLGKPEEAAATEKRAVAAQSYASRTANLEDELRRSPLNRNLYLQLADQYGKEGQPDIARRYRQVATILAHNSPQAGRSVLELRAALDRGANLP
ncbi:MAG TPA: tetratricopeptide repeat protein, partial [Chthonomonadales bacterium]|nr:tetratricopeptide repeat protein [Chthonomonadales bacterium]